MKGGGNQSHGFTIVEILIVLAVTAVLLLGAILLIAGHVGQAAFDQAIQDAQGRVVQQIDQITNGYYSSVLSGLSCSVPSNTPSSPPTLVSSGGQLGANQDCVYLGTAFMFNQNPSLNQYTSFPVVGKQCSSGYTASSDCVVASNLDQSVPVLAGTGTASYATYPNDSTVIPLDNGLTVAYMCYNDSSTDATPCAKAVQNTCAFALLNNPETTTNPGNLVSGGVQLDIYAYTPSTNCYTTSGLSQATNVSTLNGYLQNASTAPVSSVEICLVSGSTNQSAMLTITGLNGGTGGTSFTSGNISTTLNIENRTTCQNY